MGLDVNYFITERGGKPDEIRKSQEKRENPVELVQQVIDEFQGHRKVGKFLEGDLMSLNFS
jgi:seryl-tRNA synthetase